MNCISKNKVTLNLTLAMDMAQFIDLVEDLRSWIIEQSNKGFNTSSTQRFTKKQLFITNVTDGSVNCLSTLSVGDPLLVQTVASGITTGLNSG